MGEELGGNGLGDQDRLLCDVTRRVNIPGIMYLVVALLLVGMSVFLLGSGGPSV